VSALIALCLLAFTQAWADEIGIKLISDPAGRRINEGFLGTNVLYWIDDDEAWAKGDVPARLKELGIKTLRYPGGEVADNYDWETNSIERKNRFPFEAKTEEERRSRLDYKEFLANVAKIGVKNIFFVVNLEGAFFQPGDINENIERYAEKAARWVKAVREAGYMVPYWEIGNESYLRSAYPLTAREYASALKVFYRKMKAVDPSIKIGAIGPHSPYGDVGESYADALGPIANQRYRAALVKSEEEPCKELNKKACARSFGAKPAANPPKWWEVMLEEARYSFDFVVIHRYGTIHLRERQADFSSSQTLKDYISDLKKYIEDKKGARVELALTEWNTPRQVADAMTENEHLIDIAEQMGNYLEGGVDYALYWPFRMKGKQFPIVSFDTFKPRPPYQLFKLFNNIIRNGNQCTADYDRGSGVYVLCSQDSDSFGLMLVNRTKEEKRLAFESAGKTLNFSGGESITGSGGNSTVVRTYLPHHDDLNNKVVIDVPPQSITGVTIESK
jgi:hypothetical protein